VYEPTILLAVRIPGYILAAETFLGSITLAVLPTILHYLVSSSGGPPQQQRKQVYIICRSLFTTASGAALIAALGSGCLVFLVALGVFALVVGFYSALKPYVASLVDVKVITRL